MISFEHWLLESKYNLDDLKKFSKQAKVNISKFSTKELLDGINTEKEHKFTSKKLDVIGKDEFKVLKIALAHLEEDPHYYKKLKKAEL